MISKDMLMNNYLHYVNIIECIRRGSAEILYESMDSILIRDIKADLYLIAAQNLESAKKAIKFIPSHAELVLAHEEFYCDLIAKKCGFKKNIIVTYHSVWTSKEHIKVPEFQGEIKVLTMDNFQDIKDNYNLFDIVGEESIRKSIADKKIIGAFIDEKLCGFIGEHEEGSIGMLHVFDEYRRRGIGYILQAVSINKALDEGRIPFGEIIIDNKKSLNLQRKLGLEISKDKSYWLE